MARVVRSFDVELSPEEVDLLRESYLQQAKNIAFNFIREKLRLNEDDADERINVVDVFETFKFEIIDGQPCHAVESITVEVEVDEFE